LLGATALTVALKVTACPHAAGVTEGAVIAVAARALPTCPFSEVSPKLVTEPRSLRNATQCVRGESAGDDGGMRAERFSLEERLVVRGVTFSSVTSPNEP
jgi:hypothetical protein